LSSTRLLAVILVAWTVVGSAQQPANDGDRVILMTLDGARHQEVFGGLNVDILQSTLRDGQKAEEQPAYKRFWADTPEARRMKLMPFFWGTLMTSHGSIAGNRSLGSVASLTNTHSFSYPGYAELVLGEAHDDTIKSNDPIRNPYPTVLEALKTTLALPADRVATFASWGVFNAIVEHEPGATYVDAGPGEPRSSDPAMRELVALQNEALPPWGGTRFDIYTFKLAMAHLAAKRPRVVYIAFDETDDWAHDGRYDRVLDAYARTDRYLEQLWTWLQSQPDYRGRTHLLITTDHGRGRTTADWRNHGASTTGANEVWMAFVSPRMSQRGEWRNPAPLTSSQVAATLADWLGLDWVAQHPSAGKPIR
jgi:Type I phosphodiesterase / nucleotide pyrophosphatase